jgi:hypothetical protein
LLVFLTDPFPNLTLSLTYPFSPFTDLDFALGQNLGRLLSQSAADQELVLLGGGDRHEKIFSLVVCKKNINFGFEISSTKWDRSRSRLIVQWKPLNVITDNVILQFMLKINPDCPSPK